MSIQFVSFIERYFCGSGCNGHLLSVCFVYSVINRAKQAESVRVALKDILKQIRVYGYVLQKKKIVLLSFTSPFLIDTFLRAVPLVVEHRVKDLGLTFTTFEEARGACIEAEAVLRQRHGGQLPQPMAPIAYPTTTTTTTKTLECYGCGGNHLRKDCRYRTSRCARCGKLGHINTVCKTFIIEDNVGNPRAQITSTNSKVQAEFQKWITVKLITLGTSRMWLRLWKTRLSEKVAQKPRKRLRQESLGKTVTQPTTGLATKENPSITKTPTTIRTLAKTLREIMSSVQWKWTNKGSFSQLRDGSHQPHSGLNGCCLKMEMPHNWWTQQDS